MRALTIKLLLSCLLATMPALVHAQLVVDPINGTTVTADTMAASLLGASSGISITSATYTGANGMAGNFSGGTGIIGIGSGILLTSGSVNSVVGPNNDSAISTALGLAGDAQLTALAGDTTFDASVLTITFVPTGSQIQFSYVFGSEEYNEFINQYNDAFGLFVNGVNLALIPSTSLPVSINNINCGSTGVGTGVNCNLFVNNSNATINTQLDGMTVVLTVTATVTPNVPNTLKIAIADTGDDGVDSAVFIAAGSLTVCGGPNQPPCVATDIPTLGEWSLIALALFAGLIGMNAIRRRG